MTGRFTIPGRLPGLNDIVGEARYNRFAGATQKKRETRRCAYAIIAGQVPTFRTPVSIRFAWYEPNGKRDPDNIRSGAKFILDALVTLNRLPGDGKKWIRGLADVFPTPDPVNPRIEVEIVSDDNE